MRTIRLPARFKDWPDYGNTYKVDVLLPAMHLFRCRACGEEFGIESNRGKLKQRAHVCPNGCNGKPRVRSGGQPPMLRRQLEDLRDRRGGRDRDRYWEEGPVWEDFGPMPDELAEMRRVRKLRNKNWLTVRMVKPSRWAELDRLFAEGVDVGDDSFLEALDRFA